ncbi:hypothetical protein Taro_002055 [Colocasia esculenta]|uniref:Uncharacterized protein n=1 Tax=Colocasia esculenta TaxID=4460 RepID=A0A843TCX4_COLES|nr:hypothetical protein [Colocasia esculenta]
MKRRSSGQRARRGGGLELGFSLLFRHQTRAFLLHEKGESDGDDHTYEDGTEGDAQEIPVSPCRSAHL